MLNYVKWQELPLEIQNKMLERQYDQNRIKDEKIFIASINSGTSSFGFNWANSPEGHKFWEQIIKYGDIEHFYTIYEKEEDKPLSELIENFKKLI